MESAFGWIQTIWDFIVSMLPHIQLLRVDQRAVKFRGKTTKVLTPGYYWYVPMLSEVVELKINRQTSNLPTAIVPTKTGQTLAISPVVVYTIDDVHKAVVDTDDVVEAIADVTFDAVTEYISCLEYLELVDQLSDGTLKDELTSIVGDALGRFGVKVEMCFVSELSNKFHRVIGDAQVLPGEEE